MYVEIGQLLLGVAGSHVACKLWSHFERWWLPVWSESCQCWELSFCLLDNTPHCPPVCKRRFWALRPFLTSSSPYLLFLAKSVQLDYCRTLVLCHHLPEVSHSARQWDLSSNKHRWFVVSLKYLWTHSISINFVMKPIHNLFICCSAFKVVFQSLHQQSWH